MVEFKGTKGELELKYVSGVCIGIGTFGDYAQITANTILPDTDEDYKKEEEEILANMKLYAAAPEMLKALDRINKIIYANSISVGSEEYFEIRGICCDLIKKATE